MKGVSTTPTTPYLFGREVPLARLGGLLGRLRHGDRVVVFVAGEAGIGKTSLIRAAVSDAAGQGAQVAWGTCTDVEGAPGYWPWTQALDGLVRDIGVDVARARAGEDAAVLASIVASFGVPSRGDASARDRMLTSRTR